MAIRDQDAARARSVAESIPERMGDFRLIERLGAGGMGVVYLARQESLQRDVALKLILPEHLYFDEARERFRREVEAVAKLNHPGVVPVYSVGEEQGLPYFTMELIEGCSLAAVLEELRERPPESLTGADLREALHRRARRFQTSSGVGDASGAFAGTWVQACCRLVLQVAEALQHAHERGVVHRDVKPSNIVVTPAGRAMLLDFGLAIDENASRITRTGSHVGSMPYMPPERVRGGAAVADARGDVYSLGVSFYELLCLRLPFEQKSIQELLAAIALGDCTPLHARNPAVPWDTATVCATAMERDPDHRYPSTEALVRDLRNLLELKPIEARAPSTRLRARRWIQRHPTASVAAGLGFLLFFVAPSVAWWRIARERDAALAELRARESMLDFLGDVITAGDPDASTVGSTRSIEDVIDSGTERIREDLKEFPEIRSNLLSRLALVQGKLGRVSEARKMSEEALALARSVYGPDHVKTLECERGLGIELFALGELDAAGALFRHVREVMIAKKTRLRNATLWNVDVDLANVLLTQRKFDEAQALLDTAGSVESSTEPEEGQDRVAWFTCMSEIHKGLGQIEAAESDLNEAIAAATKLWGRRHITTTRAIQNLAVLYVEHGKSDQALPLLLEVEETRAETGARESIESARLAHNLAAVYNKQGKHQEALEEFQRSLALTRRFAGDSAQTAKASCGVGAMLFKLGRLTEAEVVLRESLELGRRFIPRKGMSAIESPMWLARCRAKQGDRAESALLWQEVLDCLEGDAETPAALRVKFENEFADVLQDLGRDEESRVHRERAQQLVPPGG